MLNLTIGIGPPATKPPHAGLPAFVPLDQEGQPATLALDLANDRGWYNGKSYGSLSALLAVSAGTRIGDAYEFGPVFGAEEWLTNGHFDSDVSGWTSGRSATIAAVGGECQFTGGGGSLGYFIQSVSGRRGRCARLTVSGRRGSSTNSFLGGGGGDATVNFLNGGATSAQITSTATSTITGLLNITDDPAGIGVRNTSSAGAGTAYFDNLSLVEAHPFETWPGLDFSIVLSGTVPSLGSSPQVLIQGDNDDSGQKHLWRVILDIDGVFKFNYRNNSSVGSVLELGSVAVGQPFRLAIGISRTAQSASLDGKPVVSLSATMPGTGKLRVGKGYGTTNSLPHAALTGASVVSGRQPNTWLQYAASGFSSAAIWTNGDSYTDGAYGVALASSLRNLTGRIVINDAVGGSTLRAARDRLVAAPHARRKPLVIWDGSANGYGSVEETLAIVDEIVAWHGDAKRIIIVPSVSVGPSSSIAVSSYTSDMEAIRDGIIARGLWPAGAEFDPTARLNAIAAGSAQDLIDMSARVVCQSLLNDQVHLKQAAMDVVTGLVASTLSARGI